MKQAVKLKFVYITYTYIFKQLFIFYGQYR